MKTAWVVLWIVVLFATVSLAGDRGPAPAERRALETFAGDAKEAEAAYRETIRGVLKVLESRLVDLERAAVRREDLKEANRVRYYRGRIARLAREVVQHDYLAGLLPDIGKHFLPPTAKEVVAVAAGEISEAEGVYRAALTEARKAAQPLLAAARKLAVDSADLDAANRVQAVRQGIVRSIAARLKRLEYTEYRFSSLHHTKSGFLLRQPEAWRVEAGELIGTERGTERLEATIKRNYRRISAVTVRGRILPPATDNFRMTVGPVNLIFNWERAAECHFRFHEKQAVVSRDLLTPGKEHEITVRQLTPQSIEVTVDGKRVWITHGTMHGTVTVYPSRSTIAIREIRMLALPADDVPFDGPRYRRW